MQRVAIDPEHELARIDCGQYAASLEAFRASVLGEGAPNAVLVVGECAIYLGDVERARDLVTPLDAAKWLDDSGERGAWARRARLVLAEAAFASRDFGEADRRARSVVEAATATELPAV